MSKLLKRCDRKSEKAEGRRQRTEDRGQKADDPIPNFPVVEGFSLFLAKSVESPMSALHQEFRTWIRNTTWKVSAPEGGANPYFSMPERKKGYFESLAEQGFQNNLPSRVETNYAKPLLTHLLL